MPAQSVRQILNFNENWQRATRDVLNAAGYCDSFIERSNCDLPRSRIEVSFATGEALNECVLANGDHEYDFYSGRLKIRIATFRPDDQPSLLPGVGSIHSEWSAATLDLLRESQRPFTTENLPYYAVKTIRLLSVNPDLDPRWMEDFTEIEFYVEFGIRSDAWPL
jgi:hypothetical protein